MKQKEKVGVDLMLTGWRKWTYVVLESFQGAVGTFFCFAISAALLFDVRSVKMYWLIIVLSTIKGFVNAHVLLQIFDKTKMTK
jgi:hypothetical protein